MISYVILLLIQFVTFFCCLNVYASDTSETVYKGYVIHKLYPIKFKVSEIDKEFFYNSEISLDDNSFSPELNKNITAETELDYSIENEGFKVFIPRSTRFIGHISSISSSKSFNRNGNYHVTFDKVLCPDGQSFQLGSEIVSADGKGKSIYNPAKHLGKTTLGLVGGSLLGGLISLQVLGIPLSAATHGYSVAIGAGAGGIVGAVNAFAGKGKEGMIEPGNELVFSPVDIEDIKKLGQIMCSENVGVEKFHDELGSKSDEITLNVLSIKEKKDSLGGAVVNLKIEFTNNSTEVYKLSNFVLRDSQGKEYLSSISDIEEDVFMKFPPHQSRKVSMEFYVDHPKANHWLVLKGNNFTSEIGIWKLGG